MSEQPANYQDSGQHEWQIPPLAATSVSVGITEIRSIRKNVCAECGERVDIHAESCEACGASLTHAPRQIRCMHCHTTASSELIVCPGCGRELREAPPKLMTVGAPAVLALLLMVVLVTQWERISPVSWLRSNLARGVVLVEDIGARIEPEVVIVMTPIVQGNAPVGAFPPSSRGSGSDAMAVAIAPTAVVSDAPQNSENYVEDDPTVVSMAAQDLPIGIGGPQRQTAEASAEAGGLGYNDPGDDNGGDDYQGGEESVAVMSALADEPAPTETPLPTDTPSPTATAEPPTATPTVEPTATEAASIVVSTVASSPTPTWTAMSAEATVTALPTATSLAATAVPTTMAAGIVMNGMAAAAVSAAESNPPSLTPAVMPTVITAVISTPGPTPTPTPFVHQVRSGDTLVTIASMYDVTVDDLMTVNDMSEQDVYVIQPGQMLLIPVPTPVPARLEAPQLAIPPDGATLGCSTGGSLAWQRVQFVKDSDRYVLHLGFVSGAGDEGQESVTWVVAQSSPATQTEWQLDTALCDLAPADYGRQWRWWVEVVESGDGNTLPVSPPSEIRRFVWQ